MSREIYSKLTDLSLCTCIVNPTFQISHQLQQWPTHEQYLTITRTTMKKLIRNILAAPAEFLRVIPLITPDGRLVGG